MDTLTAWDAFIGQYVTIPRAGYVLIAFAIFLLGRVACKLFRDRDLARFGETTTGTVVRVSEQTDVDHAIVQASRVKGSVIRSRHSSNGPSTSPTCASVSFDVMAKSACPCARIAYRRSALQKTQMFGACAVN
jgi:hypothetical protein